MSSGILPVILENIPAYLRTAMLWCVWTASIAQADGSVRHGKFPISAISGKLIGVDRPYQWYSFRDAVEALGRSVGVGLGVLMQPESNLVGIDLDDAVDDAGSIKAWAVAIVQALPTYWELSPSGRGLRAFVHGSLPENCPKKLSLPDGGIEVYCQGRFLTVTGHRLPGSVLEVQDCPAELNAFISRISIRPDNAARPAAPAAPSLPPADINPIIVGCGWMRHCRDDAETLSEPEWYAALSVVGRCQNGEQIAHQWSEPYPNYSAVETTAKVIQALEKSGPATCQFIETGLGQGRFCAACTNRGRVRSPIVLGTALQPESWPEPERLESALVQVATFDPALLPDAFRPYAIDVAERLQVPLDFLGAALLVSFGSVTGRRARIRPKVFDDWEEGGNLWGGIVADPGSMKTPSIKRVTKILQRLEEEAAQSFADATTQHERDKEAYGERKMAWKRQGATADGGDPGVFAEAEPEEPTCVRFIVNDATLPMLQRILAENPAGILLFRDELAGFFGMLDSKGRECERPFYLESWAGDQPFTLDRITRGTIRAARICLSLFGGIQPAVLRRYLLGAIVGGDGDDGLPQRLQIVVYPDLPEDWRNVDREPDRIAEDQATNAFRFVATMPPEEFVAHFDRSAQDYFNSWRETLERRLRRERMPAYFQAHLAKYRGLFPRIALLCHLADSGFVPEIPLRQAERAGRWCEYLETHAKRVYAEGSPRNIAAVLGDKIRTGALGVRFTMRELQKKGWAGLTSHNIIRAVLRELEDSGWIRKEPGHSTERGGRPSEAYRVNPRVYDGRQPGRDDAPNS
jgi:putative DNA primase/helicase